DTRPLKIDAFIENYAAKQYGLGPVQAREFKQMLLAIPYEVSRGEVKGSNLSLSQLLDSARLVSTFFNQTKPSRNKKEFEHYRLISDTRLQYLKYQDIEARANDIAFNADKMPVLINQLNT